MFKRKTIAGLDIGTSKVCIAVGGVDSHGKCSLLDFSSVDSQGFSAGTVTDLGRLSDSVSLVFERLKEKTRPWISTVFLSLNGTHITGQVVKSALKLPEKNSEITRRDLKKCIEQANSRATSYQDQRLHTIAMNYCIDGHTGIENPVGMFGTKLEAESHVITARGSMVQTLTKAVNYAGFEVEELVWSGLAGSFCCLSDSERDMGSVLVDIGAGLTSISFLSDGRLRQIAVIDEGADAFTEQVSQTFRIPFDSARLLKERYGAVIDAETSFLNNADELLPVKAAESATVAKGQLLDCLSTNANSLLSKINACLSASIHTKEASSGVVITGGGSMLEGLAEAAEKAFNMPVRIATPKNIELADLPANNPRYTSALGLVCYGFNRAHGKPSKPHASNPLLKAYFTAKDFIADYF